MPTRISYTTFAPPEFAQGAPLRGALPPAPQEEQMRASKLYQVNELDLGLPKPVARVASPVTAGDSHVEGRLEGGLTLQQNANAAGGSLPPPAGWRPGMLVDLPVHLPPMPPGSKCGDPVLLPGDMAPLPLVGWKVGDEVVLPVIFAPFSSVEGGGVGPPVPLVPPGGSIFVQFVNFDLNPELEETYGSEYNDEDGSSDDKAIVLKITVTLR